MADAKNPNDDRADEALKEGAPEEFKNTDPDGAGHGRSKDSGSEPIVKSHQAE